MTEIEARIKLESLGYINIDYKTDSAYKRYPPHSHENLTAHLIVKGSMTLTMFGRPHVLKSGDMLDVPKSVIHEAVMGENGCEFLTAEKLESNIDDVTT